MKALIADDYVDIARQVASELRHMGYETQLAYDGHEALRLFEASIADNQPFDVAVIDYMMPYVMGDVVIERIRRRSQEANISPPLTFLLTGSNDGNLLPRVHSIGLGQILLKPDGVFELKRQLSAIAANP